MKLVDGDLILLANLIETFISQTQESISIIESCIKINNYAGIRDQIHKVSPSVEYFSLSLLMQVRRFRETVISEDSVDMEKGINEIKESFEKLKEELVCILDEIQTNSGHKVRG